MPRIRSLKPDFFKDEDLVHLPFLVRIGYQGLWCWAEGDAEITLEVPAEEMENVVRLLGLRGEPFAVKIAQ